MSPKAIQVGKWFARAFEILILLLIVGNTALILWLSTLNSDDQMAANNSHLMTAFQVVSMIFFGFEYVARVWSCVDDRRFRRSSYVGRLRWMAQPLSLIDLAALLAFPFWAWASNFQSSFESKYRGAAVLRIARVFRVISIFRMERQLAAFTRLTHVMKKARNELFITLFVAAVCIVVAASLMYYAENPYQPTHFYSIPDGMWWAVNAFSTVGYGDLAPVSRWGRVLGGVVSFVGIGLFALPAGILGSRFTELAFLTELARPDDHDSSDSSEDTPSESEQVLETLARHRAASPIETLPPPPGPSLYQVPLGPPSEPSIGGSLSDRLINASPVASPRSSIDGGDSSRHQSRSPRRARAGSQYPAILAIERLEIEVASLRQELSDLAEDRYHHQQDSSFSKSTTTAGPPPPVSFALPDEISSSPRSNNYDHAVAWVYCLLHGDTFRDAKRNAWRRCDHLQMAPSAIRFGRKAARIFEFLALLVTGGNAILVILMCTYDAQKQQEVNQSLEVFIVHVGSLTFFSFEYLLRLWSCVAEQRFQFHPIMGRIRWMLHPLSIIDLVAIAAFPFWMWASDEGFEGEIDSTLVRLARVLRVISILKMERQLAGFSRLASVLKSSRNELLVTGYVAAVMTLFSGALMYFIENPVQPEAFPSLNTGMWWAINALSTVGYGDLVPKSPAAKVLGGTVALTGIGLFALPAGIIGGRFTEAAVTGPHEPEQPTTDRETEHLLSRASVNRELSYRDATYHSREDRPPLTAGGGTMAPPPLLGAPVYPSHWRLVWSTSTGK